ncbi:MAG: hypothetical protein KAU20_01430 [Nanoarchaeota archaeon]|nr:hypothetical protein [Nanoarchaeota archaeon]
MADKNIFAKKALAEIPRILGLMDRNKLSPTYGCFDRNFWHYKTVDFPTGMAQLGVLPLALVYSYNYPDNPYYKKERIKELAVAGISYLEKSSHKDGTTDEFYPYERALGATSFSLIACTEAYMLLGLDNKKFVRFFKKRADWMIKNTEPNVIANHQLSVAVPLVNVYLITKEEKYLKAAKEKIKNAMKWWNDEGWFYEYEGCDPGYSTFAIDFLAKYYKKTKDKDVLPTLKKSIEFCSYFIAPDGSYGGEYGSRNTSHFRPDGFEIMGEESLLGLGIVDKYLEGIEKGKNEFMNDEKYMFYDVINYLQAYIDFNEQRPGFVKREKDFEKYFEKAKIYVTKKGKYYVIISLAKGGVIKIFRDEKLVYKDNGFIAKTSDDNVIVSQLISNHQVEVSDSDIIVKGKFDIVKFKRPSVFSMMVFRVLLLSFAWNWKIGSLVKHLLVKILITGKKKAPFFFERIFKVGESGVEIVSTIKLLSNKKIKELYLGTDHAVIMVPTSNYFQEGVLFPWINLNDKLQKLNSEKMLRFRQTIK